MDAIDIFIPSYHRPTNVKSAKYLVGLGYPAKKIHIFLDSETDDKAEYEENIVAGLGCQLHIFDMDEARRRYDYVHRASQSRRSAGQARNMFMDFAKEHGIDFYLVMDDDTENYQVRPFGKYFRTARVKDLIDSFAATKEFMLAHHIGLFGFSQTGDIYSNEFDPKFLRRKVMNTTFVIPALVYRGERGVQDDDTSLFAGVMNEGYFTGSFASGIVLLQTPSATAPGGLTDLYNECKLLNKSLVTPIQFPSAIWAEKQIKNGGRIHHRIDYRYLMPKILRVDDGNNIAWDTYPEDTPFTNEPKRAYKLHD